MIVHTKTVLYFLYFSPLAFACATNLSSNGYKKGVDNVILMSNMIRLPHTILAYLAQLRIVPRKHNKIIKAINNTSNYVLSLILINERHNTICTERIQQIQEMCLTATVQGSQKYNLNGKKNI